MRSAARFSVGNRCQGVFLKKHRSSWLGLGLLLVFGPLTAACGVEVRATSVCRSIGICDPPERARILVDVLCDASRGSTCNMQSAENTLATILPVVASRPGSMLRLWSQGTELDGTVQMASAGSTQPPRSGTKARQAHEKTFVQTNRAYLLKALEPTFSSNGRRSPIAEAISRVAVADAFPNVQRWIVLIGDAREVSQFVDFECGELPMTNTFLRSLHRERVLAPGLLKDIHVRFSYIGLPPVDRRRCPVTMRRSQTIEALWRAALEAAGATSIRFSDAVMNVADITNEDSTFPREVSK